MRLRKAEKPIERPSIPAASEMSFSRLIAPGAYTQGPDILADPTAYEAFAGDRAFLLGGDTALSTVQDVLTCGLRESGLDVASVESGIEACTYDLIDKLATHVTDIGADVVCGVGGGAALDTSKGVAAQTGAELVLIPTIASTDAPCSSVAVVYDENGGFAGYVHCNQNPGQVIVDTRIVANAPVRFLRYGMGDAFATRFEADAVAESRVRTHAGGTSTVAARVLAHQCFETLDAYGEAAISAVKRNAVTSAVERIVEANTLLSGIGFESGGLAGAHAFSKGFSRAGIKAPHGLLVAFGTLAQLVLEDCKPAVFAEALDIYRRLGFETTLADLDVDENQLTAIAKHACDTDTTMKNLAQEVTTSAAKDALRATDELVRAS